ncbi:MAG: hypothetical protein H6779_04795 [Candidatus Nomurabacteria bacterium]|nr:MAG: hypothetical protein H6779_04795 [Candidatus Nomurabacteria bacterium]
MFFSGANTPYVNEQDMYRASDTYVVNLTYVDEENDRIYFDLIDYNKKLFNGRRFILITDSSGPKEFDFYTINGELVLIENDRLDLILKVRGID